MDLEWNGSKCGIVTPADAAEDGHPEQPYVIGDEEDCAMCSSDVEHPCIAYVRPRGSGMSLEDARHARGAIDRMSEAWNALEPDARAAVIRALGIPDDILALLGEFQALEPDPVPMDCIIVTFEVDTSDTSEG